MGLQLGIHSGNRSGGHLKIPALSARDCQARSDLRPAPSTADHRSVSTPLGIGLEAQTIRVAGQPPVHFELHTVHTPEGAAVATCRRSAEISPVRTATVSDYVTFTFFGEGVIRRAIGFRVLFHRDPTDTRLPCDALDGQAFALGGVNRLPACYLLRSGLPL